MKPLYSLMVAILLLMCGFVSGENKTLVAGFGAEGGEAHMARLNESGINSHFLCVRIAPQMDLTLDENGRVVGQMSDEKRENYYNRAKTSAKHGIDLYLVSAYFEEYIKQLEGLGGFTKAYVQGPTRYIQPGEKRAPGTIEEKYWLGQLLCEAKFVAELSKLYPNVKGFLVDVEMYAGDLMWRGNSSFDDQTFSTVMKRLGQQGILPEGVDPAKVDRAKRYDWLNDNNLLENYFSIETDLVIDIARRFRKEIDAINPDFQLGILPYEANWFYDGWVKGLATEQSAVLVCSEEEYNHGLTLSAFAQVARLKTFGVDFRYVPGLFFLRQSPKQMGLHARRCLDAFNGYWMFTTYSLWQDKPENLHGAYLMQADRDQYFAALGKANRGEIKAGPDERYVTPGYTLLTNNDFYPGPKVDLPLKVTHSKEPDAPLYGDPKRDKMFNGAENEAFATFAWRVKANEEVSVVVDFSRPVLIERLRLLAGHVMSYYPSVVDGSIEISTSLDNKQYYPLATENLLEGRGKDMPNMDYHKLGIRGRYVKLTFKAKHVITHSVWSVSELAVWGTP